MDYNDYKKHMEDNDLIESPESVQNLVNAIQINKNIKNIQSLEAIESAQYESYGLNPNELLQQFANDKDVCIKQAIKYAYERKWTVEMFGTLYPMQMRELQKNMKSTVAEVGLIDVKRQMGVE